MSNPFDDLESADETDDESSGDPESAAAPTAAAGDDREPTSDRDESPGQRRSIDDPDEPGSDSTDPSDPAETGPAFEYSDVRQKPLYARGETWDEFEKKLRTSVGPYLAEADVVDEETREIHDAVLRVAIEESERVGELVLEARRDS